MAQIEGQMFRQPQLHEDYQENDFNFLRNSVNQAVVTRRRTIDVLRQKAEMVDRIYQGCALSNRDANILSGVVGGGFAILAGGITLASGGTAAPIVLTTLTSIGTVSSVGGGAWSVKNDYDRDQRNNAVKQEILQQLAEDDEALRICNEALQRIERGDFGEPSRVFRQLHIFVAGLFGIAMNFGSNAALHILKMALPPIACLLSSNTTAILLGMVQYLPIIAGSITLEGVEEAAEQSGSLAVKHMYNGFFKDLTKREAVTAASKAYKEVIEEVLEEAAQKAAGKVAKEGGDLVAQEAARQAAKEAASKAAKESATKAANTAASRAVEEGAKTAAKITGLVSVGFGAFTFLWEGYNAYQNHNASQQHSKLGNELRFVAQSMEESLGNRNE